MAIFGVLAILLALGHNNHVNSAPVPLLRAILNQADEQVFSQAIEAYPEADFANDFILRRISNDTFVNDQKRGCITFKLLMTHPKDATVIIMNGHEDLLRRGEESKSQQQTFVVLQKKSIGVTETDKGKFYHDSYAYLRNLFLCEIPSGLGLPQMSDGVQKRLEFDSWDRRGGSGNYEQHFGWYFLVRFAFEVFAEAVKNAAVHLIKIVPNTILTLKTAFIKILQNNHILTICPKCIEEERQEVRNNAIVLYTLIQFLMDRFEPRDGAVIGTDAQELEKVFNAFYMEKAVEFTERVEWYTKVPLGKNIYTLVPE